jgi:hypothetical protein
MACVSGCLGTAGMGDLTWVTLSGENENSQASTLMREPVRRLLAWGVLLAVLLPMVIAVVLGLGALLFSLGDKAGAAACGRIGLVIGVAWFLALAATATASGIMTLEGSAGRSARPVSPVRPDDPPLEQ